MNQLMSTELLGRILDMSKASVTGVVDTEATRDNMAYIVSGNDIMLKVKASDEVKVGKTFIGNYMEISSGLVADRTKVKYDVEAIELLYKYSTVDKLNKGGIEEITRKTNTNTKAHSKALAKTTGRSAVLESQTNIVDRSELEDKIVYLYEDSPRTNSLALAKQFNIKHKNVMQKIFLTLRENLYLLTQVQLRVYSYKSGKHNHTIYTTYLEISEKLYFRFISTMGKPKTLPLVMFRHKRLEEYREEFLKLRGFLYNFYDYGDMKNLILYGEVTGQISILMETIYIYTMGYNILNAQVLRTSEVCKLTSELINNKVGIDAITFSTNNRDNKDLKLQKELIKIEDQLHKDLEEEFVSKRNNGLVKPIISVILDKLNITKDEAVIILSKVDSSLLPLLEH